MRPLGFSTGALAKGDFKRGLRLQRGNPRIRAVELSALREHELPALVEAAGSLELAGFDYVSVHAPSKLGPAGEHAVFEQLAALPSQWPIIVHPEILRTPPLWRTLGRRLCLENMDDRKTRGRTVVEMRELLEEYPEASFCLDVGHARQLDPTMAVALRMLLEFGDRLVQLHVSEVGPRGEHQHVAATTRWAFELISPRVPWECPLIIESMVTAEAIDDEIMAVMLAFPTGPQRQPAPA
jgi:hypothetical protein